MLLSHQTVYHSRPFLKQYPEPLSSFSQLMDMRNIFTWSFGGGTARDLYLNKYPNDLDILIIQDPSIAAQNLNDLEVLREIDSNIPTYLFTNPFVPGNTEFPVHFIQTQTPFAPVDFDFSINQLILTSNREFFATAETWRDFDQKIIRLSSGVFTTNTLFRSIRFALRFQFSLHPGVLKKIKEKLRSGIIGQNLMLSHLDKFISDGVSEQGFDFMKELNIPYTDETSDFQSLYDRVQELSLSPNAITEDIVIY